MWTTIFFYGFHHVILDTNIIYNQAFVFAIKNTVYARNCLDKGVLLQWFVNVHNSQRWHIKTSNPHINNNSNFEIGVIIFELLVQHLAVFFCSASLIQLLFVIGPCVATRLIFGRGDNLSSCSFVRSFSFSARRFSPQAGRIARISFRRRNATPRSAQTIIAFCTT